MEKTLDFETAVAVCGVDVAKAVYGILIQSHQAEGLGYDTGMPIGKLVETLACHYVEMCEEDGFHKCLNCGGEYDRELPACGFCGAVTMSTALTIQGDIGAIHVALVIHSEEELDAAVRKTHEMKSAIAGGHWALGKHITGIFETQMWKARTTDEGAPAYKKFETFCLRELKMTDVSAYKMMDVAKHFDEATVAKLGTEKLDLILKAPDQVKQVILDRALTRTDSGEKYSKKELVKDLKEAKRAHGSTPRVTGRQSVGTGRPRAREVITLVEVEGDRNITLLSRKGRTAGKDVPATTIEDAVGFHALVNEVMITLTFQRDAKGNLVACMNIGRGS
jgi:hypothetical protein